MTTAARAASRAFLQAEKAILRIQASSFNTSIPHLAPPPSAGPSQPSTPTKSKPGHLRLSSTPSSSSSKIPPKGRAPDNNLDIPLLSRPLGVSIPPTSAPKTWAQKKDEMLDADRHKAKRRALVKEATSGYFRDYNRARAANGGKLWTAPPVLIREDRALYFPDISGKNLLGESVHTTDILGNGKISLLTILNTRLSEEHAQSFIHPTLSDQSASLESKTFQYIQINHQPNPLKSMLLTFFLSSLKRTVPEQFWSGYIVSGGEWSSIDITDPLGIDNTIIGYTFLIDQNLKVRWAGCGPATSKETEDLRTATAVLIRRLQEENGNIEEIAPGKEVSETTDDVAPVAQAVSA